MSQEQIRQEYLTLLQKPILTDNDLKRGRQLVNEFKRTKYWDRYLKQYIICKHLK